ncbi:autotransporter-associated beta strand repeat-containing protein, partial [Akkermansiaceae bacterium]|nr:autotransporter-associated beta strand repeat-containing protein [Akkermansiaceae bacterium]
YWTGTGGGTWDQSSTVNFTTNAEAAALAEDTFANAVATSLRGTFADAYFDSNTPVTVTANNITIAAGGVSTDNIDFANSSVAYTVASSDANGIAGATNVTVNGGGSVTFLGTHALTGSTNVSAGSTLNIGDGTTDGSITDSAINSAGTLVYNNVGAVTQTGALGGTGTLEKHGVETLTVAAAATYTGATTITGGKLTFQNTTSSSSFAIASGATLEFNTDVPVLNLGSTVLTGTGIVLKTGTGQTNWGGTIGNIALGSGALIDIQQGSLRAGSNANEVWTNNLSDVNIAAGATLFTQEASARVDVITGDGTVQSGFNHAAYADGFTMGVDNGSGTFNGVIQNANAPAQIYKEGTGTQTLTGVNTYTGNTTVEDGAITLADGGQLAMVPAANGVNNVIQGGAPNTGTINLDGALNINLGGADTTSGNNWLLVDDANLTVNYGGTFAVTSSLGAFSNSSGVWTLVDGANTWTFTQSTGALTLVGLYDGWAASFGLTGGDAATTADLEAGGAGDGLNNLLEFAYGTDPTVSDNAPLSIVDGTSFTAGTPVVDVAFSPLAVTFRYTRRKDHVAAGLTYSPRFIDSTGAYIVDPSAPTPTVVSTQAGDYEVVEVPFPLFDSTGRKADAMLAIVDVTLAP